MADIAVPHTLSVAGPSVSHVIAFNTDPLGSDFDVYYITEITGLDGAPIRAPVDNAPQQHGGIAHDFWKGGRHILVSGVLIVQSTRVGTLIQITRNVMEDALRAALEDALQTEGTWVWTPAGDFERTLNVKAEIPLECQGVVERRFTFGLYAAEPDWAVA